jgi:hypothetical protein
MATAERRVHGERAAVAAPGPLLVPHGDGFEPRSVVLEERPPLAALRRSGAEPARTAG